MNRERIRSINPKPLRHEGDYVLYWMTAYRRTRWNQSLDRALDHATALSKPLVILEALRAGYRWASDRLHRFVIDGMADNDAACARAGVTYHPYIEPRPGDAAGLLETLAGRAAIVVTDDFPCFFLPRMIEAAGRKLDALGVGLEAVDGNGLYPMRAADRVFPRAFDFRRHLQWSLPEHFADVPRARPFRDRQLGAHPLPDAVSRRWPRVPREVLQEPESLLPSLPIDHGVAAVAARGGERAGRALLGAFVDAKLSAYAGERNDPAADGASGLSPYLHFGHVSAHEVFARIAEAENWSPGDVAPGANGKRTGWWGMGEGAESFLDQLVTWRELGFNMCAHRTDYDRYASLPKWARETLAAHANDRRPYVYSLEQLEQSKTHDPVWNAAQTELVREGRIQNYLRMLWGKKILHWSQSPEEALEMMIELNNKYAVDGRDPNSYNGIFWVLGRYDRAWGPERSVFGKVRYMSSDNTRRKLRLGDYLETFGDASPQPSMPGS